MKDLKQLVIEEATNIKLYATEKEIDNLDIGTFDAENGNRCIYGQMVGNCFSYEANLLLNKCTKPYSRELHVVTSPINDEFINNRSEFSPIEYYILQPKSKNKTLIDFIKGDIQELTVDML